jgi:phytoene/squalene synthetase
MNTSSANLGQSITFASSKQSYYTARLLVDKGRADDCLRAYAYLRWVDDVIDAPAPQGQSVDHKKERAAFIKRQKEIVASLYNGEEPTDLTPEETMVADLIRGDSSEHNGLHSFICNFLEVLEFDALRKGRLISEQELHWYSHLLGKSVTDGIQYFIGNGHPYPDSEDRYLAATAAHITHMLRDMKEDLDEGFINIPREYLESQVLDDGIRPDDLYTPQFQEWVRGRVALARSYIRQGKRYLDQIDVLRCKIAGYWYCARFELILDAIERDDYILRDDYKERQKITSWLKISWLGLSLSVQHIAQRFRAVWEIHRNLGDREYEAEGRRCRMIEMNW